MRLFFLGNREECLGFALAGARSLQVESDEEFEANMQRLFEDEEAGVIIAADRFFETYSKRFSKRREKKAVPAVVFVPSIDGSHRETDIKGYISGVLGIRL
ncbi:V-type ATP synthase subunit F [Hydrogenimonas sp.]